MAKVSIAGVTELVYVNIHEFHKYQDPNRFRGFHQVVPLF